MALGDDGGLARGRVEKGRGIMLLILLAAMAATPGPSEPRTFHDWTVGCDNGLDCQAIALLPPQEEWSEWLTLRFSRDAAASAAPVITIQNLEAEPAVLLADGNPLDVRFSSEPDGFTVHSSDEGALIAALGSAHSLEVRGTSGTTLGRISLSGATAAMLYMDEAQRRLDTVSALVRTGARPANAVPPPPDLPLVRLPPAPTDAPLAFSDAEITALREEFSCTIDEVGGPDTFETAQVETGTTLILLACGSGAYNLSSVPLIARSRGGQVAIEIAPFDPPSGVGMEDQPTLTNAEWDAGRRLLKEYSKARGLGDCGVRAEYAWDGSRFRIVHQEQMGECQGSLFYIPTWNAEIVAP
jgi:hypothetical protein